MPSTGKHAQDLHRNEAPTVCFVKHKLRALRLGRKTSGDIWIHATYMKLVGCGMEQNVRGVRQEWSHTSPEAAGSPAARM